MANERARESERELAATEADSEHYSIGASTLFILLTYVQRITGAFGYFEVTHDITRYCKASLFEHVGKKTPLAVRFSQVGKCLLRFKVKENIHVDFTAVIFIALL